MDTEEILQNYSTLNKHVMDLTEDQLEELKQAELDGERRRTLLDRIQGRINKLRSRRESAELLKDL